MKKFSVEISEGKFKIQGLVQIIGQDILLSTWGGTRPHIGSVALAQPRPSLSNPKKWSSTSSDLTLLGHKEDLIAKKISERLASNLRRNAIVTVGFHWDNLTNKEIKTVEKISQKILTEVLKKIPSVEPFEITQHYGRIKK